MIRTMHRTMASALAAFVGLQILVCCPSVVRCQTLRIYDSEPPAGYDAYHIGSPVSERLLSLFSRPTLEYEYAREMGPDEYNYIIAERPISSAGNTLKIKIRSDAKFRFYRRDPMTDAISLDSSKVTPNDVIVTYRNLVNRQSVLLSTWHTYMLGKYVKDMSQSAPNEVTVQLRKRPSEPELLLTFPIAPAALVPEGPIAVNPVANSPQQEFMNNPVGVGPYVFAGQSIRSGVDFWRFSREDGIRNRTFQEIEFRYYTLELMANLLDHAPPDQEVCIPEVPLGFRTSRFDNYKLQPISVPIIEEIVFNNRRRVFEDQRVRAALSLYVDRTALAHIVNDEVDLITGPIPRGLTMYCEECDIPYYVFDVSKADSLLMNAGWRKNGRQIWEKGGEELKVDFIGFAGSNDSKVAQFVKSIEAGWKSYGVNVEAKVLTRAQYNERLMKHDFDAAYHVLRYRIKPDLTRYFIYDDKETGENYSGFVSSKVQGLWTSLGDASPAELQGIWHQVHREIGLAVPCAFLWSPRMYAVYSDWIGVGDDFYPSNFLGRVERWTVD